MNSPSPDEFERALDQIREGELDSMLSAMFGSKQATEDEHPTEVPHTQPGRNGRHRAALFVGLIALAGASLITWGANLGQRHTKIQETEVRLIAGEQQLENDLAAFGLEQQRLAAQWEQEARDQREYALKLEAQERKVGVLARTDRSQPLLSEYA